MPPPADFNPELERGTTVGEYVIEDKIGDGGFGTVYRATHPVIGKAAAVKVLRHELSANPEMVHRFISEARAVNKIRHRNIIDIFSFGKLDDGRRFYVMELLEGRPLDVLLDQRGALDLDLALPILAGISRALEAAHSAGVLHRDLKPENVFLVPGEHGKLQVKLLDFGIAKLQTRGVSTTLTGDGVALGTPHYMSPEQWRGKNVDHRTDVYAFGVVAYLMLTGAFPYDADNPMEIMVSQSRDNPKRPSQVNPALPPAFDVPLLALLARETEARPGSVAIGYEAG
jgi:serine/threonine-protein kinase